ncbi:hypothetical protein BJ997_003541 [Cryobacterium roopkundense]|uniref:Uncharacterized protein n=1 Tax=Cryobacterium roopkundense TaxID=1001240 RepID=A0A7W8ZZB3_9MICO|nr:hypothetical protein [Cryobacterium roopkundense]
MTEMTEMTYGAYGGGGMLETLIDGSVVFFAGGGLVSCVVAVGTKLSGEYERSRVSRRSLLLGLAFFALAGLAWVVAVAIRSSHAMPA